MDDSISKYIYWICQKCNMAYASDRFDRWHMDWCECGASGVDAEELYCRTHGQAKIINKEEYDEAIRNTSGQGQ